MSSLGVDNDNNVILTNGQLTGLTGRAAVKQRVRIRLRSVRGEWFLNPKRAPDWFGLILTKPFRDAWTRREIRWNVLDVQGVRRVKSVKTYPNQQTQVVRIVVRYLDIYGNDEQEIEVDSP